MSDKALTVECDNCGWSDTEDKLRCDLGGIPDLYERIEPGGEVPVGECPDCGALCYYLGKRDVATFGPAKDSPVTKQAMAIMEEQARRLGLDPKVMREDRLTIMMVAAVEACEWIRQHAPGRALDCLEAALEKVKHL